MTEQNKNYYLVTENNNWADEFDIDGGKLITSSLETEKEVLDNIIDDTLRNYGYSKTEPFCFEIYFGSNEAIEFSSVKEMEDSLHVYKLTKEEYDIIKKFIGTSYGLTAIL